MVDDSTRTAGIDTAKATLDVAVHGSAERLRVENRRPGWRRLAQFLGAAGVGRVGIEASGEIGRAHV